MRKYKSLLITTASALFLNIIFILNSDTSVSGSVIFLMFFLMGLIILFAVDVIKMYSDDMNKKSGYMLFMTPNSGYKIIMSKLITCIIEGFAMILIYLIFAFLNGVYVMARDGVQFSMNFMQLKNGIEMILDGRLGFNLGQVMVVLVVVLIYIIGFILTVFTSITIRKSIFSEIRFGGFLSFLIFIGLNWIVSDLSTKIMNSLPSFYNTSIHVSNFTTLTLMKMLFPVALMSVAISIVLTLVSGYLLENKINL
jgi:hypothetical protein